MSLRVERCWPTQLSWPATTQVWLFSEPSSGPFMRYDSWLFCVTSYLRKVLSYCVFILYIIIYPSPMIPGWSKPCFRCSVACSYRSNWPGNNMRLSRSFGVVFQPPNSKIFQGKDAALRIQSELSSLETAGLQWDLIYLHSALYSKAPEPSVPGCKELLVAGHRKWAGAYVLSRRALQKLISSGYDQCAWAFVTLASFAFACTLNIVH